MAHMLHRGRKPKHLDGTCIDSAVSWRGKYPSKDSSTQTKGAGSWVKNLDMFFLEAMGIPEPKRFHFKWFEFLGKKCFRAPEWVRGTPPFSLLA